MFGHMQRLPPTEYFWVSPRPFQICIRLWESFIYYYSLQVQYVFLYLSSAGPHCV